MFIVESLGPIDTQKKKIKLQGSCAFATNNHGWIVGVVQFAKYDNFRPFLWRPGTNFMHDMGLPPGASHAQPVAINDKGQVVIEGYPTIYTWSVDQGYISIDDPLVYLARDISENGTVVASKEKEACIIRNGIVTKLGKLPGSEFSAGVTINKNDEVAGYSWFPGGKVEAFLWKQETGMKHLSFGAPVYDNDEFVRINDLGHVLAQIGSPGWTKGSTYRLWKPDGGFGKVEEISPPPKPDCSVLGFNNYDEIFAISQEGWYLYSEHKWQLVLNLPISFGGDLSGYSKISSSFFIGCFNDSKQVVGCVYSDGKIDQAVRAFPNPQGKIQLYHKPEEILPGWVYQTFPPIPKQQSPDLLRSLRRVLTPLAIIAAAGRVMDKQLRSKIMKDSIESVLSILRSNAEPEDIIGAPLSYHELLTEEGASWLDDESLAPLSDLSGSTQQLRDTVIALELAHRARAINSIEIRREVQRSALRAAVNALESLAKTWKEKKD
jgi:hypothetical protein